MTSVTAMFFYGWYIKYFVWLAIYKYNTGISQFCICVIYVFSDEHTANHARYLTYQQSENMDIIGFMHSNTTKFYLIVLILAIIFNTCFNSISILIYPDL
jgi:hypothetical protein